MSQHAWCRIACLCLSLAAMVGILRFVGIDTLALAGPAGTAGLSLPRQVDSPILLVKDKVDKPKKGCDLCNDKGYCLVVNNEATCQTQKTAVEKNWGPDFKWQCICSKKPKSSSSSDKQVCCWLADNPAYKSCGDERQAKNALLVSSPPGKAIECRPYN